MMNRNTSFTSRYVQKSKVNFLPKIEEKAGNLLIRSPTFPADPVPNLAPPAPLAVAFDLLFPEGRIGNSDPKLLLSTEVCPAVTSCAGRCIRHAVQCNSFDFAPAAQQCRLFSLKADQIIRAPSDGSRVYARQ